MIDNNTILPEGQIFQPYPDNASELIRYTSGRWERSIDAGKKYSYRQDMQEKNRTDALALCSIRIVSYVEKRPTHEEVVAMEQGLKEDKKRPLYERHFFSVHDGLPMAVESSIDDDIDNSLKAFVEGKKLEIEWFSKDIRMLLRDYYLDNPEFDIDAFIEEKKNKVTDRANALSIMYPAFQSKFKHGASASLRNRLTELLKEFKSAKQIQPALETQDNKEQSLQNLKSKLGRKATPIDKAPKPALSPNEIKPKIYIPSVMQTRLLKTLSGFTPPDQHTSLEALLNDGFSNTRIWVKLSPGSLAYVFRQAIAATTGSIQVDMTEMARWLAAYLRHGKETPKNVSENTTYKVLRNNSPVAKTNQIRLKL